MANSADAMVPILDGRAQAPAPDLSSEKSSQNLQSSGWQTEGLYSRLRPRVYSFALFFVQEASLAEDFMQEAFLRFYANGIQAESEEQAYAWLSTVVRNLARDRARRLSYRTTQQEDAAFLESIPDQAPSAEAIAESQQRIARIYRLVERLKGLEKECILLYAQDMTFQEIADSLHIPLWKATYRTMKAIRFLRKEARK